MTLIEGAIPASPLGISGTFTSNTFGTGGFTSISVSVRTDATGELLVDQSSDGTNWDSTLSYDLSASINEVHRIVLLRPFFRIRIVNGLVAQTYIRGSVYANNIALLSSPLNSTIQQDADTIVVRSFAEEFTIAESKADGYSIVNKFGRNPDIDTGTLPEDIWGKGGIYTGFPTGAPEEIEVFSSNAGDTGQLTFTYLASNTSTAYQTATVTLNGTTAVPTGITAYRVHTAQYASGSATGFNLGLITIRHRVTVANIFLEMPIGRSQTTNAAYTVPAGSTGYIKRLFASVIPATSGSIEGSLWIRTLGGSPRLRRPFSASDSKSFEERPYGGIPIAAGSDIQCRVILASANNMDVTAGYDLLLKRN